jgi:hypothetical protein
VIVTKHCTLRKSGLLPVVDITVLGGKLAKPFYRYIRCVRNARSRDDM